MTTPTVAELRKRAKAAELRTRIAQLRRVYPDTLEALTGALTLEHPDELERGLTIVEGYLRAMLAGPPRNPVAEAVAQIQARKRDQTMTTDHVERSYLIEPEVTDTPHPLGRVGVHHDRRNREFRALVQPPAQTDRPGRAWPSNAVFDQADQNCTAEAAVGLCRTFPHRLGFAADWPQYDTEPERIELYRAAQLVDPFPQTPPTPGSSTDAPFRVLRDRGQIAEWRWLFGEVELWNYVTNYGPACVGTLWYRSMFTPTSDGVLIVDAGTGVAGGHAWRIVQAHAKREAYRMVNSWGRSWGQGGRAWVARGDMAALLAADGEAVTIANAS